MNISVMSRPKMEKMLEKDISPNIVIISFKDTKDCSEIDFRKVSNRVFQITLDDVDFDELNEYGRDIDTYFPEVEELAQFIKEAILQNMDIICQCEYGQSRSAACAAAILEAFEGNGISVFSDYRYYPNKLIYNKLIKALKSCIGTMDCQQFSRQLF